ncbi:MAG: gliding motility-associated C-terminal domain-containing protein [Saprospiraceae bacterium]|nr:gliding motility-associated C-terminal domain-containing protein [Candidatus Defluviibacterium haderslevense]
MKIKIFIVLIYWVSSQLVYCQELIRAIKFGGNELEQGYCVAVDDQDNVYSTGFFTDTVDFDPGPLKYNLIEGNSTSYNLYISKLDSSGKFIWAKSLFATDQRSSSDFLSSEKILISNGFIYIVGRFTGSVDFDPGPGTYQLNSTLYYRYDGYILKLDLDGNFQWVKHLKGRENKSVSSIDADSKGNLYCTGYFSETIDFDFGPGVANLRPTDYDTYILKLAPNGNFIWVKQFKGDLLGNSSSAIKIDNLDNIYVLGQFYGTMDFDPGQSSFKLSPNGDLDAYLVKLDPSGNFVWANTIAGPEFSLSEDLAINASGFIYCIGDFYGSLDFNLVNGIKRLKSFGEQDVFICKFNPDGKVLWANNFGSPENDGVSGIALGLQNEIFISGSFQDIADFYSATGGKLLSSKGTYDLYLLKLDLDGNYLCVNSTGNSSWDFAAEVTIDKQNNLYLTGSFNDTVDFDFGLGVTELTTTGINPNPDAFLLKYKNCFNKFTIDTVYACDSYTWLDGVTYFSDNNTSLKNYRKASCCDSTVQLNLKIYKSDSSTIQRTSCDSFYWNGVKLVKSGIYSYTGNSVFGCDSFILLDLTILHPTQTFDKVIACDSYTWNGITYNSSGKYSHRLTTSEGCDSIAHLELVVNQSIQVEIEHFNCGNYHWNGNTYLMSGDYSYDTVGVNGCDSTTILHLTFDSIIRQQEKISTCNNYNWNGILITTDGIYTDTFPSINGCDSIITLDITIKQATQSTNYSTSCDSLVWNGNIYTQSGTYNYKTQNANGCDSIATLQLTIYPSTNSTSNMSACDSLTWNNNVYKQSGTYQYATLNASGCDSIATLQLIIHPPNHIRIRQTACNSYTWNGNTFTQSGSYNYQTISSTGCDSLITLDLNIIPSSIKDTSITICDSITFLNKTLNTKGNYTFTLQNTQGCDSVINLNLNINSQHFKSNISTCGSYQWDVNGTTYDSSGMYVAKYTNRSACDSIYQLDLTIHKNFEIKEKAEVCKEYFWPVNKVLYNQSGDYIYPLKTNHGCDSIIKLNLLVNPEFQHADTVTTTDAYTWPVNQKTYPTSGTYKEIYTTKEGCDSIHLLLLSINKDVSIYYPNIIHPGGLNSNFTIYVYGASANIKTLSIYDRWGERIWQKQNFPPNELQQGWDGKYKDQDVMPGVYVWHAEIVLKDGSVIVEKGDVTVVR